MVMLFLYVNLIWCVSAGVACSCAFPFPLDMEFPCPTGGKLTSYDGVETNVDTADRENRFFSCPPELLTGSSLNVPLSFFLASTYLLSLSAAFREPCLYAVQSRDHTSHWMNLGVHYRRFSEVSDRVSCECLIPLLNGWQHSALSSSAHCLIQYAGDELPGKAL